MFAKYKHQIPFASTIILVIVYTAGIIGIHSDYQDLFLRLTPVSLLVSIFLLFINHKHFNSAFYIFCLATFFLGFIVEVFSVKTGIIFGEYTYDNTLGIKLFGVPLIIGINWLMLIYTVGCICDRLKINILIKSGVGAGLLVALDLLIEPVAVKYYFWNWNNGIIPVQNYISWFALSFLLLLVFNKSNFNKHNAFAQTLFIMQLVFFAILNVF